MTAASLVRVLADYGFGIELTAGGIVFVAPKRGELPPEEITTLCREHRGDLIAWLSSGRCGVCRAEWFVTPTVELAGAMCTHEGRARCPHKGRPA